MVIALVTDYKVVATSATGNIVTCASENLIVSGVTIKVVITVQALDLITA